MDEKIEITELTEPKAETKPGKYITGILICGIPIAVFWMFTILLNLITAFAVRMTAELSAETLETIYTVSNTISIICSIIFAIVYIIILIFPLRIAITDGMLSFKDNKKALLISLAASLGYGILAFTSVISGAFFDILSIIGYNATFSVILGKLLNKLVKSLPYIPVTIGIFFIILMVFQTARTANKKKKANQA